jgi:hypothetical protein
MEFGAAKAKHTVLVFTDADSPHCREFHDGMRELEAKGVAVQVFGVSEVGEGDESVESDGGGLVCGYRREALTRYAGGRGEGEGGECV